VASSCEAAQENEVYVRRRGVDHTFTKIWSRNAGRGDAANSEARVYAAALEVQRCSFGQLRR